MESRLFFTRLWNWDVNITITSVFFYFLCQSKGGIDLLDRSRVYSATADTEPHSQHVQYSRYSSTSNARHQPHWWKHSIEKAQFDVDGGAVGTRLLKARRSAALSDVGTCCRKMGCTSAACCGCCRISWRGRTLVLKGLGSAGVQW